MSPPSPVRGLGAPGATPGVPTGHGDAAGSGVKDGGSGAIVPDTMGRKRRLGACAFLCLWTDGHGHGQTDGALGKGGVRAEGLTL